MSSDQIFSVAVGVVVGLVIFLCLVVGLAHARDPAVPREFRKTHPCPATGKTTGPCPGWNMDHYIPLCAGGPDTVANLNWMTIEDHKAKTKLDIQECRRR